MAYADRVDISHMVGKTLTLIDNDNGQELTFSVDGGASYRMFHDQDCCESVEIDDICGDLQDLVGSPILSAEEVSSNDEPAKGDYAESYTWTFYKIDTIKGGVTIRWYGTSNGYYSESVSLEYSEAA